MKKTLIVLAALLVASPALALDPYVPPPRELTQKEAQEEALRQLRELVGQLKTQGKDGGSAPAGGSRKGADR